MLTQERDKVLDTLKQMPGIVKQHQDMSTPKRGEKRHLVKQTPTPKSRLKKSLFQTPTRRTSTSTCIPAQDSPAKTCTSKMDRSTQTKQTREDFDVKVKYIIFLGVNLARFFTESIYTCGWSLTTSILVHNALYFLVILTIIYVIIIIFFGFNCLLDHSQVCKWRTLKAYQYWARKICNESYYEQQETCHNYETLQEKCSLQRCYAGCCENRNSERN